MITPWEVYWITMLDSIKTFFICLSITLICVLGMGGAFIAMEGTWNWDIWPTIKKIYTAGIIVLLVAAILATLTPSTQIAYAIYLIPNIANQERVQKISNDFGKFKNIKMECDNHSTRVDR